MRNVIIRILQALVLLAVASSFAHADNFMYFKKKAAAGGGGTEVIGYTTEGAGSVAVSADTIRCGPLSSPTNSGTITKVYIYSSNISATEDVKIGVYTDNSGTPGAKVGTETQFNNMGTWSLGWKEFSPISYSVVGGTNYWLCFSSSEEAKITQYYTTTAGTQSTRLALLWTNSWPDPHGTPSATSANKPSIKALVEY